MKAGRGQQLNESPGTRRWCTRVAAVATVAATALLVACGGGTTSSRVYKPERYFAMGDELSVLTADGRKFAVNALNTTDTTKIDCALSPLWVQSVASAFGYVFAECNPDGAGTASAFMRAAAGAKVADLSGQIDAQIARTGTGGGFKAGDLVTVLVGGNDILELYAQYPTRSEAELTAEARARGERLAAQVNRLVNLGAKVIIATVPDMGLTPFAQTEKANNSGVDRAALITRLTAAMNGRVRVNIINDGRFIGLVLADELVQTMAVFPGSYGITNVVAAVCNVALPNCTSQTVVETNSAGTYLWADSTRLSSATQSFLGSLGATRALNNPF
jgi:outer membrane lipase/esterase